MESIKHKMDLMIQEKNAAVEKAVGFEAETAGLETSAKKFEKEVDEIQRKIAKVEDELDITISKARNPQNSFTVKVCPENLFNNNENFMNPK